MYKKTQLPARKRIWALSLCAPACRWGCLEFYEWAVEMASPSCKSVSLALAVQGNAIQNNYTPSEDVPCQAFEEAGDVERPWL